MEQFSFYEFFNIWFIKNLITLEQDMALLTYTTQCRRSCSENDLILELMKLLKVLLILFYDLYEFFSTYL